MPISPPTTRFPFGLQRVHSPLGPPAPLKGGQGLLDLEDGGKCFPALGSIVWIPVPLEREDTGSSPPQLECTMGCVIEGQHPSRCAATDGPPEEGGTVAAVAVVVRFDTQAEEEVSVAELAPCAPAPEGLRSHLSQLWASRALPRSGCAATAAAPSGLMKLPLPVAAAAPDGTPVQKRRGRPPG